MASSMTRRSFTVMTAGVVFGSTADLARSEDKPKSAESPESKKPKKAPEPVEAPFTRDYPAPSFVPSWKKPQINRLLVQDFVSYAHYDLDMTKKLLEKEPGLINATMDWGAGDWETGLGGASHMGRRDIVMFLLERGARIDLFCAAMLGQLETVKALLALEPKLIDAKGPHGFSLHFHAQVGGKDAEAVLEYLQSVKKVELRPIPFLNKPAKPAEKAMG